MKRPNLEVRAVFAMRGMCLLAETLTATYLDDQCQRDGGADSALLSGDSGFINILIDRRKSN